MVDKRAAQLAVVVAGSVLLVLVAGQVLRLLTRWLTWALLVGFVVLIAYATYELYSGWTTAAEDEAIGESVPADERTATFDDPSAETFDAPSGERDVGGLTDEEFEAELEALTEADGDGELEYDSR